MSTSTHETHDTPAAPVGPVLRAGPAAKAVIQAMNAHDARLTVIDRGAYLRVQAPGECRLVATAVEAVAGRAFALPRDLEAIMVSFSGVLSMDSTQAVWRAGKGEA